MIRNTIFTPKVLGTALGLTFALTLLNLLSAQTKPGTAQATSPQVAIVKEATSAAAINFAAEELSAFLGEIYNGIDFSVETEQPQEGDFILLGTRDGFPAIRSQLEPGEAPEPQGFLIQNTVLGEQKVGLICGDNPKAVLMGVYTLLDDLLGYGFYLTHNASENVVDEPFGFERWDLSSAPALDKRITYNWDNFLSGATAWNLEDWKHWIRQSARMRYSGVMFHVYSWHPVTQFRFNGIEKKVDHIQNSRRGNYWGNVTTEDVRKMTGGELFEQEGPVFGSDVSKIGMGGVTEQNRIEKAKALLREATRYAKDTVGIDFIFSYDIDVTYHNAPRHLATLPESDRYFETRTEHWLARPDTPAGRAYYKAQIETVLNDFPGISEINLWFRAGRKTHYGRLMSNLDLEELPREWHAEYHAAPERIRKGDHAAYMLAMGKTISTHREILEEMGRTDISVSYGSWWRDLVERDAFYALNHFAPPEFAAYALDYQMSFRNDPEYRSQLEEVGKTRDLVVVQWAQHDDGKYLGRPYNPPENLADRLIEDAKASGVGVIHWMTRPLDPFFKSISNQLWEHSLNEDFYDKTLARMAEDYFGSKAAPVMAQYLKKWMRDAPQINRETSQEFAFHIFEEDLEKVVAESRARLGILERVDPSHLSEAASKRWHFFRAHEEWIALFYEAHITQDPKLKEATIHKYLEAISADTPTRGELGILIKHNLKWLNRGRKPEKKK